MSPERSEGVFDAIGWVGDRARGYGTCLTCKANDRADKRLGAGAKQRHQANPVRVLTPLFFGARPTGRRGVRG